MTRCYDCGYEAVTWHENEENMNDCTKCKGKLEILMEGVVKEDKEVKRK